MAAAPQTRSKTKRQHKGTVVNPIAISDSDGDEWKPSAAESAKKRKSQLMKSGGRTKEGAAGTLLVIAQTRKAGFSATRPIDLDADDVAEMAMDTPAGSLRSRQELRVTLVAPAPSQAVNERERDNEDAPDDDAELYPMHLSDDEPDAPLQAGCGTWKWTRTIVRRSPTF